MLSHGDEAGEQVHALPGPRLFAEGLELPVRHVTLRARDEQLPIGTSRQGLEDEPEALVGAQGAEREHHLALRVDAQPDPCRGAVHGGHGLGVGRAVRKHLDLVGAALPWVDVLEQVLPHPGRVDEGPVHAVQDVPGERAREELVGGGDGRCVPQVEVGVVEDAHLPVRAGRPRQVRRQGDVLEGLEQQRRPAQVAVHALEVREQPHLVLQAAGSPDDVPPGPQALTERRAGLDHGVAADGMRDDGRGIVSEALQPEDVDLHAEPRRGASPSPVR